MFSLHCAFEGYQISEDTREQVSLSMCVSRVQWIKGSGAAAAAAAAAKMAGSSSGIMARMIEVKQNAMMISG
jgi:hypothetical protein